MLKHSFLRQTPRTSIALLAVSILFSLNTPTFALVDSRTLDSTNSSEVFLQADLGQDATTSTSPSTNYPSNAAYTSEVNSTTNTNTGSSLTIETIPVSLPKNISVATDLVNYEDSIMQNEDAVRYIDTSSNENRVSVWWKHSGTLFTFIPVSVLSRTTVSVSDTNTIHVTTQIPWWSIFVKDSGNVASQTESNLQQSEEIKTHMKPRATPEAKAHVVYAIVSTLASETDAHN